MRKIKIGTQMHATTYQQLKLAAVRERRPVGMVIEEAVATYLKRRRHAGLARMLQRDPLPLSDAQLRASMEADIFEP
jgi:hypothetical protein